MEVTIRELDTNNPEEVKEARQVAAKAFFRLAFLWAIFPKPETALIALVDGKIVSGFFAKFYRATGKKIGYVSYFFTDPAHYGKGIGKQLFAKGISHLWSLDCQLLVSYVRDDNVGSWLSFVKNGFQRIPFLTLVPQIGLGAALRLYWGTTFGIAFGHDFYLAQKDHKLVPKKAQSSGQIATYLLVNAALFIPLLLAFAAADALLLGLISFGSVFIGLVVTGYIGTLFSKRNWRFRFTDGGLITCVLAGLMSGFLPMSANWYPEDYQNTPQFRRDIALPAIFSWLFLLSVGAAAAIWWPFLATPASVLLLFRCMIIFEPFKSYGGQRVYDWNKAVFGVLAAASLTFMFLIF